MDVDGEQQTMTIMQEIIVDASGQWVDQSPKSISIFKGDTVALDTGFSPGIGFMK